jgi:hypothetical protein
MTPSGIDPGTLRFIAQCLNQLRHREKLGCIRANFLQSRSSVQKTTKFWTALLFVAMSTDGHYIATLQAKPNYNSINQSIQPSVPPTLQCQSHPGVSPEAVTSGQHSLRAVLSVTRETAFYGSARTSGLNRCDNSSSDSRGCRFLYKAAHWSNSIRTVAQLHRVITNSLCT